MNRVVLRDVSMFLLVCLIDSGQIEYVFYFLNIKDKYGKPFFSFLFFLLLVHKDWGPDIRK